MINSVEGFMVSMYTAIVTLFSFMAVYISFRKSEVVKIVEWFGRKPPCLLSKLVFTSQKEYIRLCTIFSMSLDIRGNREIGLRLLTRFVSVIVHGLCKHSFNSRFEYLTIREVDIVQVI